MNETPELTPRKDGGLFEFPSEQSTFIPRPYQVGAIDAGVDWLTGKFYDGAGLMMLPTGSGKSLVIAGIVHRLDDPCIVFQPSKEILEQNADKLKSYGYNPAIWSASIGRKELGEITLATIGSVIRQRELFTHFKYVLIDECDLVGKKGMYSEFLKAMPHARIVGVTATPYRLTTDGFGGSILKFLTRTRPRVFTRLIYHVQNGDLFRKGYLCPIDYKVVETGFKESKLKLNSTGADYTDESVKLHFKELNFQDQIVRCVNRLEEYNRHGVLVFTRFVEESQYVADKIPGAEIVTAQTSAMDRREIIRKFRAGIIPVVSNVGVLSVGFDYPALANVVLARPTMSLRVYYQQVGRVVRTHAEKQQAWVVDMVGLVEKFGKVEDLELSRGDHDTWFVHSQGKQLTNVYFGEKPNMQKKNWRTKNSQQPSWKR